MRVQLISLVGNAAVVSNSLPAHLSMRSTRGEPERAEFYVVQATWVRQYSLALYAIPIGCFFATDAQTRDGGS